MFFKNIIQICLIMTLPTAFIEDIKPYMSSQELEKFVYALTEDDQTCCIRYNRAKSDAKAMRSIGWNEPDGEYLDQRPNFTLDPLMHAGCYYVQEASSQFVTHVIRTLVHKPVTVLDLCAAPGGKSTAMLSVLPEGSHLVSNEIDHRRARILAENITKWGNPNVTVTSNDAKDFSKLKNQFDLILTDVPCSGEGMFRKDEGAIKDWSTLKVQNCVSLQKEIVSTIWQCLKPGGILIYSTCTFNVHEDEEMLQFICEDLGADAIDIPTKTEWIVHPPLIGNKPCYRFMPHYTKGEGLFMAVVQKNGLQDFCETNDNRETRRTKQPKNNGKNKPMLVDLKKIEPLLQSQIDCEVKIEMTNEGVLRAIPLSHFSLHRLLVDNGLYILQSGIDMGTVKGKDIIPAHALALSSTRKSDAFPSAEVDLDTALNYLRHEAISLPDSTPKGFVIIEYQGHALGFVKNLGNRCNNLYPQEWRIRFL